MKKPMLTFILAAAFLIASVFGLPLPVAAAGDAENFIFDITEGNISVSQGNSDGTLKVTYGSTPTTTEDFPGNQEITIMGSSDSNVISVGTDISGTVYIALSNTIIDVSGQADLCAFSIDSGSTVELTLSGSNTLQSGPGCAGLQVPAGATLVITDDSANDSALTDSLHAAGGSGGAGIGGNVGPAADASNNVIIFPGSEPPPDNTGHHGGDGGCVVINGGEVTAVGNGGGAGIGGGAGGEGYEGNPYGGTGGNGGNGGTLIVRNGTVTATGIGGVGIGGGSGGAGGEGIPTPMEETYDVWRDGNGGDGGSGSTVLISGGTVIAAGSSGIGGGNPGTSGDGENSVCGGAGSAVIIGGSVQVSSMAPGVYSGSFLREYLTTVTGLLQSTGVSYTVNGGSPIPSFTDSDGKLYLWLQAGETTIGATESESYYTASGTVTAGSNNFTAIPGEKPASDTGLFPMITVINGSSFEAIVGNAQGKYVGVFDTPYGVIIGTVSGNETVLTGTLTDVPAAWTEIILNGDRLKIRAVVPLSTTVDNPSFY